MKLIINGELQETDCKTLSALIDVLGHQKESVATALNGDFVSIAERDAVCLQANDAIEIIAPMAGG